MLSSQRFIAVCLVVVLLIGCNAAVTAPAPTAVPPTDVPPTATLTATPVPPTSTATATPVPPTDTPTKVPTNTPTLEPTDTATPKPTNTKVATKAPTKPAATKPAATKPAPTAAPTQPPTNSGVTSAMVINTFPVTCRIVMWGPADVTLDASKEANSEVHVIVPGVYGWRAFLGGAETGEAGNLEVPAGSMCLFKCDKETLSVRYGCK